MDHTTNPFPPTLATLAAMSAAPPEEQHAQLLGTGAFIHLTSSDLQFLRHLERVFKAGGTFTDLNALVVFHDQIHEEVAVGSFSKATLYYAALVIRFTQLSSSDFAPGRASVDEAVVALGNVQAGSDVCLRSVVEGSVAGLLLDEVQEYLLRSIVWSVLNLPIDMDSALVQGTLRLLEGLARESKNAEVAGLHKFLKRLSGFGTPEERVDHVLNISASSFGSFIMDSDPTKHHHQAIWTTLSARPDPEHPEGFFKGISAAHYSHLKAVPGQSSDVAFSEALQARDLGSLAVDGFDGTRTLSIPYCEAFTLQVLLSDSHHLPHTEAAVERVKGALTVLRFNQALRPRHLSAGVCLLRFLLPYCASMDLPFISFASAVVEPFRKLPRPWNLLTDEIRVMLGFEHALPSSLFFLRAVETVPELLNVHSETSPIALDISQRAVLIDETCGSYIINSISRQCRPPSSLDSLRMRLLIHILGPRADRSFPLSLEGLEALHDVNPELVEETFFKVAALTLSTEVGRSIADTELSSLALKTGRDIADVCLVSKTELPSFNMPLASLQHGVTVARCPRDTTSLTALGEFSVCDNIVVPKDIEASLTSIMEKVVLVGDVTPLDLVVIGDDITVCDTCAALQRVTPPSIRVTVHFLPVQPSGLRVDTLSDTILSPLLRGLKTVPMPSFGKPVASFVQRLQQSSVARLGRPDDDEADAPKAAHSLPEVTLDYDVDSYQTKGQISYAEAYAGSPADFTRHLVSWLVSFHLLAARPLRTLKTGHVALWDTANNFILVPLIGSMRLISTGPLGVAFVPYGHKTVNSPVISASKPLTSYSGVLARRLDNVSSGEIGLVSDGRLGLQVTEAVTSMGAPGRRTYREIVSLGEFSAVVESDLSSSSFHETVEVKSPQFTPAPRARAGTIAGGESFWPFCVTVDGRKYDNLRRARVLSDLDSPGIQFATLGMPDL